ncbi:MAG: hypothetical protein WC676_04010 [Candidatus Omnitrophota bacterium]
MKKVGSRPKTEKCYLDAKNRFVIEDYNQAAEFSNFFPGVAGAWGIPMWCFYVNRGQGITSFGIEGKDKAIMEFQPANKAYRLTSLQGFRTFIKVRSGAKSVFYEPFQNPSLQNQFSIRQRMAITSHDLTLEEENLSLGLSISVNYFTLPEEPFAALVRSVEVKNISRKRIDLEVIDGMPIIIPHGFTDWLLKNIPRTVEAWVRVSNLEQKAPYYNLKVVVSDKPAVSHITAGNFYFGFSSDGKKNKLLDCLTHPSLIFGSSADFMRPEVFLSEKKFKVPAKQFAQNVTPSAMSFAALSLASHEEKKIVSLSGHTHSVKDLNEIVRKVTSGGYIERKAEQNKEITNEIKNYAFTASASREFDLYCEHTFLDNVLRGGLPLSFKTDKGTVALNVFSRKHGDPERDYNYFVFTPTFLSQGNGNYRDVNQNRRNDVWFNTDVRDSHLINFLNLIQPDGFNPLTIKGAVFSVTDTQKLDGVLKECASSKDIEHIHGLLKKNFLPGSLITSIVHRGIRLNVSSEEFLRKVLSCCRSHESAEHGEGFWTDHWTYNLDLIESYLGVYPEKLKELLLEKKVFTFFHNSFYVVPRDKRYITTAHGCRQHHAVMDGRGEVKAERKDNVLRIENGKGDIYSTGLVGKLLCLIANKAASFDPSGLGLEMEAEKPNWYDALNGLPGLLGSSLSETLELKRFCAFLLTSLDQLSVRDDQKFLVFSELSQFISNLADVLRSSGNHFSYWSRSNDIKEHYRLSVRFGISGEEKEISASFIKEFLKLIVEKVDDALKRAKDKNGLCATYFAHEITKFEKLQHSNSDGDGHVRPLEFKVHPLPLFLEGFVHELRVQNDREKAKDLYRKIRQSAIFDKELKMYKVNASLEGESEDIGRTKVFPRGWLENESIWMHMEYKFLLELLRNGLYEEFYENLKNTAVPFLDPKIYGRSILENSSFIVSSAHDDKNLHGRGFVARLSGTTAELLHIWILMNIGEKPFSVNVKGELSLQFRPVLPGWIFSGEEKTVDYFSAKKSWQKITLPKNSYAFNFLNSALVVYHNPKRRDTFGKNSAKIEKIHLFYFGSKTPIVVNSTIIAHKYASDIRDKKVERIDVFWK